MLCNYAECRVLFIIMLNVIRLNVVMLNVVMLSLVMLSVVASPGANVLTNRLGTVE
jgi:hypothetical protein